MSKKITLLGVLLSLSLIAFMIESLFPPFFVPGARLGVSNIFIMVALYIFGLPSAIIMVIAKSILAGIFGGNLFSVAYSLISGLVSVIVTFILMKNKFGSVATAVLSAVLHNITQLFVFYLITKTSAVFSYTPYLALLGVIGGVVTGVAICYLLKLIKNISHKWGMEVNGD